MASALRELGTTTCELVVYGGELRLGEAGGRRARMAGEEMLEHLDALCEVRESLGSDGEDRSIHVSDCARSEARCNL